VVLFHDIFVIRSALFASECSSPVYIINECETVVCTYLELHFLDRLLHFIAGLRIFIIISVSFVCRVRCHSSLVSNSKKFRVRGKKSAVFRF
jgi:hypothetical protein